MLAWLLAAGIPIAIHLLTRKRQTRVRWAAMQLLREVLERESKRVRFEQLLLLLLRVTVLVLLALALARPFFSDPQQSGLAQNELSQPKLWIFGFDLSYSMGYVEADSSRLQAAKDKAIQIIQQCNQGDAFALIVFATPSQAVIRRPTFNPEQLLSEIRKLQPRDTGADILGGLQSIQSVVEEAEREPGIPDDIHICLLSDLGRDSWDPLAAGNSGILNQLSQSADLQIVSMASPQVENLAVTDLSVNQASSLVGAALEVTAEVANFGTTTADQVPVQLALDGQAFESLRVDIPANESVRVVFSARIRDTGLKVLRASIPPDRLQADNQRYLVIEARNQDRVLFVEEQTGDLRLLRMSLAPLDDTGLDANRVKEDGLLAPGMRHTISTIDLPSTDLPEWEIIVMQDIAFVDRGLVEQLDAYVQQGGTLILSFGPRTRADAWNSLLQGNNFLGFELAGPSAEQSWTLDPLDYSSPIVAPFYGYPDAGLLTTPIFRHWTIRETSASLNVEIGISNSTPFLVRHPWGSGWVVSLLSAPSAGSMAGAGGEDSWNALAVWPSFVPLMQQLVQTQLSSQLAQYNLRAGQILQSRTDSLQSTQVRIVSPDGTEHSISTESVGDKSFGWFFADTVHSGVYFSRDAQDSLTPFAVNVDPIESPLQASSVALPSASGRLSGMAGNQPEDSQTPPESLLPNDAGQRVSRWLLGLLLVLLLSESLVAWQIGRRAG